MLIAFHVYSSKVLIDYGESQVSEKRTNATSSQYASSANFIHISFDNVTHNYFKMTDFNNLGMSMHSVAELCCFPLYVAVLSRVSQKVRDCRHTKKHLLFE